MMDEQCVLSPFVAKAITDIPGLKNYTFMVAPPLTIKASTSPVRLSQPKAGRAVYRFAFLCGVYDPVSRSDHEAVG